ncbi:MAG: carbohydrate porin [Alphaproteobacteria bacterium]|nr:carbohydrate porin [Alphaproteobacteria bacterium]
MKNFKYLLLLSASFGILSTTANASPAEILGDEYSKFKNHLSTTYGFDYGIDYSLMWQRTAPSGSHNAVQSYLYPYFSWTTFDNRYGTGTLNFAYDSIFYGHHDANDIGGNSGMVTPINDFTDESQEFSELYFTYQFPDKFKWLTLGLGQYSLYNFDGSQYNANQQVNFINYSLSQNATATYASAGLGAYLQTQFKELTLTAGMQDASNIDATGVRFNRFHDKHYTTFGEISYNPTIKGLGQGQYSVMVYNQPAVSEQPQTTTGWSVNLSQFISEKFNVFAAINGVNGSVASIDTSYTAGIVYNNPLNRNELDQIGLAYAYNSIDENAVGTPVFHKAEQIVETYWAWGIGKWATITPDLQIYFNPALNDKSDYGFAGTLRLTLFF